MRKRSCRWPSMMARVGRAKVVERLLGVGGQAVVVGWELNLYRGVSLQERVQRCRLRVLRMASSSSTGGVHKFDSNDLPSAHSDGTSILKDPGRNTLWPNLTFTNEPAANLLVERGFVAGGMWKLAPRGNTQDYSKLLSNDGIKVASKLSTRGVRGSYIGEANSGSAIEIFGTEILMSDGIPPFIEILQ